VPTLVIAIGNRLCADDGIAHRVVDLLEPTHGVALRRVHQLAPEIAAEMQDAESVIFLDADLAACDPSLERIASETVSAGSLSHSMSPATLVTLSARLYGFRGEAWMCRLPARDFTPGGEITPEAGAQVARAAQLVTQLLESRCMSPR
jgi:hydrogenase maturation protease